MPGIVKHSRGANMVGCDLPAAPCIWYSTLRFDPSGLPATRPGTISKVASKRVPKTATLADKPLQRPKSLADQAAADIRARIIRGDFPLGASLSENTLALELGVSKTPVREALLQLKMEGLVSIHPQRGTFVFDMSAEEIRDLGELRETLEIAALRLATSRHRRRLLEAMQAKVEAMRAALDRGDTLGYRTHDADFHQALIDHCGNRMFATAYAGLSFRIQALRTRLSVDPVLNESSYCDHKALCALIEACRDVQAADLLAVHVRGTVDTYVSQFDRRTLAQPD